MELECTQRLLRFLKKRGIAVEKTAPVRSEIDPFYQWVAQLVMIQRRHTIVVTHGASQCMFFLHGITVDTLPNLSYIVHDGIRKLLMDERIDTVLIQRYLTELGETVVYVPNRDRRSVALSVHAVQRLEPYKSCFQKGTSKQRQIGMRLNDRYMTGRRKKRCWVALHTAFAERYGTPVVSYVAARLVVRILGTNCQRTIHVPNGMSLYQLHRILQCIFAWDDRHMHRFVLEYDNKGNEKVVAAMPMLYDARSNALTQKKKGRVQYRDEQGMRLFQVLKTGGSIFYEYDLADGWMVQITQTRGMENWHEVTPECCTYVDPAPLEDCGGVAAYKRLSAILQDPEDPRYDECVATIDKASPTWRTRNTEAWVKDAVTWHYRYALPDWRIPQERDR